MGFGLTNSISPTAFNGTKAGTSVDVYENYAVVGLPDRNGSGQYRGAFSLYRREGSSWAISNGGTYATASSPLENEKLGTSIAIYKNYIIAGAPYGDNGKGRVILFEINTVANTMTEKYSWTPNDVAANENVGCSVDIYENTIIVGGKKERAFILSITDSNLSLVSELEPTTPKTGDMFGSAVSIFDEYAVVSAPKENNIGAIYVFQKGIENADEWGQAQRIVLSDGLENDDYGYSVSIHEGYIAIGAPSKTALNGDLLAGRVYILKNNSDTWFELTSIEANSITNLSSAKFGCSVALSNEFLVVGASGANTYGIVEVFSKKRNWAYVANSTDVSSLSYGFSVGLSNSYYIVGAPTTSTNKGAAYLYENIPSKIRLAQEFEIPTDNKYVPTKASLYLKKAGQNLANSFEFNLSSKSVIDSTNFSVLTQKTYKMYFDDRISGFTGNGYMTLSPFNNSTISGSIDNLPIVNYPISTTEPQLYNIYFRVATKYTTSFSADILFDGLKIQSISKTVSDVNTWEWVSSTILMADTRIHTLGIKIKEQGNAIDKIYIDAESITPYGYGPSFSDYPYVTTHLRVFSGNQNICPNAPLFMYDSKTTLNEIKKDDWYNYRISILDTREGYTSANNFNGNYYLVFTATGVSPDNYVIWELLPNSEYTSLASALKV